MPMSCCWEKMVRENMYWQNLFMNNRKGKTSLLYISTWEVFRKVFLNLNCSDIKKGPSQTRIRIMPVKLKMPRMEPSFLMKSETCLFSSRPNY